ncbi:uncharacterized protein LOC134249340 [Saccostrea cucullata]|uniref:uncharacterized protein LOC134249340 n=1 Tax=Saccostrea cuccullata TaxID=36930 RepID=UPI002ED4491F
MASNERSQGQHFLECDVCKKPGSFCCRRCGVNLCDPCVPMHLRIKSVNGHDVVDYTDKDVNETCICASHPQQECCAYCNTCDSPICLVCVSIKHKSHEMSELSEKIEELLKEITRENELLQSFKLELEKIIDHSTKRLSSLCRVYEKRKQEVKARGEKWHKYIEEVVKHLHQELDDMQKEHETVLQRQKNEFEEILQEIDKMNTETTTLQKSKNIEKMKKFIPVIKKQETDRDVAEWSLPVFYQFETEMDVFKSSFGYIEKMRKNKVPLKELIAVSTDDDIQNRKIFKSPKVIATIDTDFSENEYHNRLHDMVPTNDKKMWIVGVKNELKLYDLQGVLYNTIQCSEKGSIYVSIYNTKVVFTRPTALKTLSEGNTEVTMFEIPNWIALGIISTASDDLLISQCRDDQYKIVRYSGTGTMLQELQYDSQSQPLYNKISYIAENVNGDIMASDWGMKAVIAVNKLGIFRFSYTEKESTFFPSGLTTDSVGHIFICNRIGDNIHMLDGDGRFLRYIIPDQGISYPCVVCIITDGELIVGEGKSGRVKRITYMEQ